MVPGVAVPMMVATLPRQRGAAGVDAAYRWTDASGYGLGSRRKGCSLCVGFSGRYTHPSCCIVAPSFQIFVM